MANDAPRWRLIRAAEARRMPWKNGGGETVEVAVHPPGAGIGDFDWRVSLAGVAADGPFSTFPGVDRTLAVVRGAGLRLEVGTAAAVTLGPESAPLTFAADAPTRAQLTNGAVRDLNVMTRRALLRHRVERHRFEHLLECRSDAPTLLWLCQDGAARIRGPKIDAVMLGPLDALFVEAAHPGAWRAEAEQALTLFQIEIGPVDGESVGARGSPR
ncbi:MAG: HutD family protein [Burkholderiales bacterium]|nr:HutD family protein [Burkholderiales bacterium]MDE2454848.1 HutD family protein [Burkholderiales bacterium]